MSSFSLNGSNKKLLFAGSFAIGISAFVAGNLVDEFKSFDACFILFALLNIISMTFMIIGVKQV